MTRRTGWHRLVGVAVVIDGDDVDTDQIFPARFLQRPPSDYGAALFGSRRYADGDRQEEPLFVLNRGRARGARVLVCGANFGCGSAREHAAWALRDFGIRALLAPSFNEIFRGNCARNGIAALVVEPGEWRELARRVGDDGATAEIDLQAMTAQVDGRTCDCRLPPMHRRMLIEGLDEVALTAEHAAAIEAHERRDRTLRPWNWLDADATGGIVRTLASP